MLRLDYGWQPTCIGVSHSNESDKNTKKFISCVNFYFRNEFDHVGFTSFHIGSQNFTKIKQIYWLESCSYFHSKDPYLLWQDIPSERKKKTYKIDRLLGFTAFGTVFTSWILFKTLKFFYSSRFTLTQIWLRWNHMFSSLCRLHRQQLHILIRPNLL